ncbi:hypothetical protein HPC62_02340 [Thermoleptolyngbya sichuanensis A183]|uniref:Uncharacterized protein n=1 Tax=Thermoleptolyngbya sichuanensis A183 TaxID=2737172 RepID=A0A6M8BAS0_9CYAN|nr:MULTISPECIES: hypothetical protein [Thermoleptolyngbya]QKD81166.1 hypothetical protein HPC62_02340 [Thermoleptolyngbya sichuanensis A183]
MLTIHWSSPRSEATQFSLPPLTCELPHRRRLRHYLVGSAEDTQLAIDRLHQIRCAERFEWTPPVSTAENGVILRPDPGDVLRYMQRTR